MGESLLLLIAKCAVTVALDTERACFTVFLGKEVTNHEIYTTKKDKNIDVTGMNSVGVITLSCQCHLPKTKCLTLVSA